MGVNTADKQVLRTALACGYGRPARGSCGPGGQAGHRGAHGTVAAAAVRGLCLGELDGELDVEVRRKIRLCGLRVTGPLDLADVRIERPVSFVECEFADTIDLSDARAASPIRLEDCRLAALVADRMRAEDDFAILCGRMTGTLSLVQASLDGTLRCSGTHIHAGDGRPAIDGTCLRVTGSVLLDQGFHARGEVRLAAAHVGGDLNLSTALCGNPGARSFDGASLVVAGELLCTDGFRAEGEVYLHWAQLRALRAKDATFAGGEGNAIKADGARVATGLFLQRTHATGRVSLVEAKADGELNCTASVFEAPRDPDAPALDGTRFETREIYLNEGFTAIGAVRLGGARVSGQVNCAGGQFRSDGGKYALDLGGLACDNDVFLSDGFRAAGQVSLSGATIQRDLSCWGGAFEAGHDGTVLDGSRMRVAGSFAWHPVAAPNGLIDLSAASVGRLTDAWDKWPAGKFDLTGFAYGSLDGGTDPEHVRERLCWLADARRYSLQAYQQLATVYRQQGLDEAARRVELQKHRERRKSLPWHSRIWSWFQDVTVGYGYRLYPALFIVMVLGGIGTLFFYLAQHHHLMVATDPTGSAQADHCTEKYPCFTPYAYSFQLLLPIVNLHQTDFWLPNASTGWGILLLLYTWSVIILGWMLGVALVAGLGRVFTKE